MVAVPLALAWAGSMLVSVRFKLSVERMYDLFGGAVGEARYVHPPPQILSVLAELPTWEVRRMRDGPVWQPYWSGSAAGFCSGKIVALWPFVLISTGTALWLWRRDALLRRRERVGVCVQCGYDRVGLAESAACPECGRVVAMVE